MASVPSFSESVAPTAPAVAQSSFANFIDRWMFVIMAALLVLVVLSGFVPSSLQKIGLVEAGVRDAFPPLLHAHAALMGSWMLLLLAQTTLMATGRSAYHKQLGMAAFVLAPLMLTVGFILIPTLEGPLLVQLAQSGAFPAEMLDVTGGQLLLLQMRIAFCFLTLIAWGLLVRRRDPGLHKRLMILGTIAPIYAALDRIPGIPRIDPLSPISIDVYVVLLVAPLFVWDLVRSGRVHRAYVIWAAVYGAGSTAVYALEGNPWWIEKASSFLGI
jgi:hypothetical protein